MYKCSSNIMTIEPPRWWFLDGGSRSLTFAFIMTVILPIVCTDDAHLLQSSQHDNKFQVAYINISYSDRDAKREVIKKYDGKYGKNSIISSASGVVMHAISSSNKSGTNVRNNFGCSNYINPKFPSEHWIAFVERGDCSFTSKIRIATKEHNATAVVIYNGAADDNTQIMSVDKALPVISVLLPQESGKEIAYLLEMGYTVRMQIIPGPEEPYHTTMQNSISKTSVLFVSISFIVLMIISLAWLVFYYIQRFRYSHAKERLARRLVCAAKKAIAKIPQRTVKAGDKELDSEFDQCAVCIEPYKAHDVIRILPCRHVFHKSCVDPWLLDQRSCPMCKLDILRAFGMQVGGSQESVHHDAEAGPVVAVVQEPEVSSSVEDTQTDEIKVLLVPHTCLHFRSGCDKIAVDDEEASSSLLGAVGGVVPKSSSSCSVNSKASRYSRTEKSNKEDNFSSEMKSLIGKDEESRESWQNKEENSDEDEECEFDVNAFRAVDNQEVVIQQEEDVDSLDSSSTLSFPPPPPPLSLSSEQFSDEASDLVDEFRPDEDDEVHRDSLAITIDDNRIIQGAVVKVEFHENDELDDIESRT